MGSVRARVVAVAAALAAVLVVVLLVSAGGSPEGGWTTDIVRVNGTREADGVPFILEGDLYLPDGGGRAPAVLLAHGWGGNKDTVADQAKMLADRGFVVLAYSARGFGRSGGKTHLDSLDYEVKDAQRMLDLLATRPEVELDGAGDPRVGVAGASYGGALGLMLAGVDHRVDAVVSSITWNNLSQALFPQFAVRGGQLGPAALTPISNPGVFKKQWTALLAGTGATAGGPDPNQPIPAVTATPSSTTAAARTIPGVAGTPPPASSATAPPNASASIDDKAFGLQTLAQSCGRLDPQLCFGYIEAATTGRPSSALLKLLERSSPSRVANRIAAPTLLVQGEADSLFPLSEAEANARAIASNGTPVQLAWTADGHDGGVSELDHTQAISATFLRRVLGAPPHGIGDSDDDLADDAGTRSWAVSVPDAVISSTELDPVTQRRNARSYPGLPGTQSFKPAVFGLSGDEQLAVSPPGATPAALTSVPGAGSALGVLGGLAQGSTAGSSGSSPLSGGSGGTTGTSSLSAIPGQFAHFDTQPLTGPITITGSSRVTVRITSTAKDASVFASLVDVAPDGRTTLPEQLVSPVRLDDLGSPGRTVTIALPAVVHDVPAGHRLRVIVSSTDQAYAVPNDARGYRIALAKPTLSVPVVPLVAENSGAVRALIRPAVLLALAIAALVLAFVVRGRRRRHATGAADPELAEVPLAVQHLGKAYNDGFRAVRDVSFRVETGQVMGLLGPNGAGKTTTLRMLMGLIMPSEGEIRVFGHRITPGAPVLSRLGSFIEGPGFLPHLSGLDNLQLYWKATGRPEADAQLERALDIAGLGDDVQRKVRTYSQGMRQRLAIAQAMLGLPDLLVLDEPTNGLDPPQIRQMRAVLQRYAETGRTVIVSSHLLAEVEQTCTHLVVMAEGRLVAAGTVAELVGASTLTALDVSEPERAASVAEAADGVSGVETTPTGITVHAGPQARAELVRTLVEDGFDVQRVAPQRGLEETFLALVGREDA